MLKSLLHTKIENNNHHIKNNVKVESLVQKQRKFKASNEKVYEKIIESSHHLSIITLNANNLNSPIKSSRLDECILKNKNKKPRPIYLLPTGNPCLQHNESKKIGKDIPCQQE